MSKISAENRTEIEQQRKEGEVFLMLIKEGESLGWENKRIGTPLPIEDSKKFPVFVSKTEALEYLETRRKEASKKQIKIFEKAIRELKEKNILNIPH